MISPGWFCFFRCKCRNLEERKDFSLNEEQIRVSKPPVDIDSCEEIELEIEKLNYSSLPNYMSIIPIHTLQTSEMKMNVQDSVGCKEKVKLQHLFIFVGKSL